MKRPIPGGVILAFLIGMLGASAAFAQLGARVPNWSAPRPASNRTTMGSHALGVEGDIGAGGTALVPVTPCRIVDTRGPAGPYGAPSPSPGSPRSFALLGGPCTGLPPAVIAYSLNITATNTTGPGFFKVFPQGAAAPVVSTLNYTAGQTVANAAIVPAGTGSGITVAAGVSAADLIIDINGYFLGNGSIAPLNPGEYVGFQGNFGGGGTVFGWNTDSTGYGVWGRGSGTGVYGTSDYPIFTEGFSGVVGFGTNASGVSGFSENSLGVLAQSHTFDGIVASGGRDGGRLFGDRHGVVAISLNTTGSTFGLLGEKFGACNGCSGVRGVDASEYSPAPNSFSAVGVFGDSRDSYGIVGRSRFISVYGVLFNTADSFVAGGLLGSTFGTAFDATTGPWGVFSAGNFGASGAKHFVEPHPSDPKKVILYSATEGRTVDTYFRGTARTVNGRAVIDVPEDFRIVTAEEGLTVQLTPVGALAILSVESQDLNRIVARSSKDVTFHYRVEGLRKAFQDFQPIQVGNEFMPRSPDEKMPLYLTEEAKRRLIANGTYNADGTVNMETAQRVGWTRVWEQRAAEARAQAESAQERTATTARQ